MPASNDGEEEDEEGGEEEEGTQFVCDWSDGVRKAVKLDMLNISLKALRWFTTRS